MKILLRFLIGFITLFLYSCQSKEATSGSEIIVSKFVNDSFEIYIDSLPGHEPGQPFEVFYYLDGNLNSGKKLRQYLRDSSMKRKFSNTLFVGIGHIGSYRSLRRRDLTVPRVTDSDTTGRTANFAQIEPFHNFIRLELIPSINARFVTLPRHNSILGHSFGGLFVIYSLLKNDSLFRHYYALSPSLWVNNGAIYDHEHLTRSCPPYSLFMSVGSLETLNRVKPSTDKFQEYLIHKNLSALKTEYKIYDRENHNSQVTHSFNDIFKE